MNGKQFVMATLIAVVLLTLVFIPLSNQVGTYNPWLDTNDDGKIDGKEIAAAANAFGTKGDPTKNVTIVGHATKLIIAADRVQVLPGGHWYSGLISVDGYSKLTVFIYRDSSLYPNEYRLYVTNNLVPHSWKVDTVSNFDNELVKTYDVVNLQIEIYVYNLGSSTGWLRAVHIYLMP